MVCFSLVINGIITSGSFFPVLCVYVYYVCAEGQKRQEKGIEGPPSLEVQEESDQLPAGKARFD